MLGDPRSRADLFLGNGVAGLDTADFVFCRCSWGVSGSAFWLRRPPDGVNSTLHPISAHRVRGVNSDIRCLEATRYHRFFDPYHDIVSCAARVIAEIVIEADMRDATGLE